MTTEEMVEDMYSSEIGRPGAIHSNGEVYDLLETKFYLDSQSCADDLREQIVGYMKDKGANHIIWRIRPEMNSAQDYKNNHTVFRARCRLIGAHIPAGYDLIGALIEAKA